MYDPEEHYVTEISHAKKIKYYMISLVYMQPKRKVDLGWPWWHSTMKALERPRQEDLMFEASMSYTVRLWILFSLF